jgi:subtilisin
VLDTGVLKSHADLVNRIADCKDFTMPKVSVVNGKCEDRNGHGTHVAGIIAADGGKDNAGIFGVAPEAKLFTYKVCDQNGSCWADDVAVAIHAAVDGGAEIINLSFGADILSPLLEEAINYAADHKVLIVAAAGNDGPYPGSIDYPAANPRVVGVGALDEEFNIPDWSSRGLNSKTDSEAINEKDLEFSAPGVNIESTWKEGYATLSGTSMATPHVAGLAALLWDANEENPLQFIRGFLQSHTFDVSDTGEDDDSGFGLPLLE